MFFAAIFSIFAFGIIGCAYLSYWYVVPFMTGFDPCLSTVLAPQEIAAIRTRYQVIYDLIRHDNYEVAYRYTSEKYRRENDLEKFKWDASYINSNMYGTELRSDSSISVCGDTAYLSIVKYEGGISYGGFYSLVKEGGQWYFDSLEYAVD